MRNRNIKILLSALSALYVVLVCFNNTFDHDANLQFVRHVLSMDDIFSREHNGWRAIETGWMQHAAYFLIIGMEYLIAGLLLRGCWGMWQARRADAISFREAGRFTAWGYLLAILLWFGVFVVFAGEWFLMWQSSKWNAESTAFSLSIVWLLMLIQHNSKEE